MVHEKAKKQRFLLNGSEERAILFRAPFDSFGMRLSCDKALLWSLSGSKASRVTMATSVAHSAD
jgi:hypothetical protein